MPDPFRNETREELLAYLTEEWGPGTAEIARKVIDWEMDVKPEDSTKEVPFFAGHKQVVYPPIPRMGQPKKRTDTDPTQPEA